MSTSETPLGISRLYDQCGIITACLIDPLSQLISKICGLKYDEPNAVGFYYETEINSVKKHSVILFNIYDNDAIPWLRLGYTMDLLLVSPFVSKITFYPLITSTQKRVSEKFRLTVIEIIGSNGKSIQDKYISYTCLLMKIGGIAGDDFDRVNSTLITGYSLVNRSLLSMMRIRESDPTKISTSIIPSPLLNKPITISASRDNPNDSEIKFVTEESRREITKLLAIFLDLFTSHDLFRSNILSTRSHSKFSLSSLDPLFLHENYLISHILGSLESGIFSIGTLNDIISDINSERLALGHQHPLPTTLKTRDTIIVTSDSLSCTFQQSSIPIINDPLRDLGSYLTHIVDSFNNPDVLTINLGCIITAYNNTIKGTNLQEISMVNLTDGKLKSRQVTITIPGDPSKSIDLIDGKSKQHMVSLAMNNNNLTTIPDEQLVDILVYIDSLRDSNGSTDVRFINLQNDITHELAHRRHSQYSQ